MWVFVEGVYVVWVVGLFWVVGVGGGVGLVVGVEGLVVGWVYYLW